MKEFATDSAETRANLPCDHPHGLLLDVLNQGGSSGSPVFDTENGRETHEIVVPVSGGSPMQSMVTTPTGLSFAVPGHILAELLRKDDEMSEMLEQPDDLSLPEEVEKALTSRSLVGSGTPVPVTEIEFPE